MSTSSEQQQAQNNTIQLDQMSLDQLDQLKQREETRMQALTGRYAQLRQAAARLSASQMAIKELQESIIDASKSNVQHCDVFVPLTESVYVPGKIKLFDPSSNETKSHDDQLLVELGTGYFVEKSPDDTVEYLNRKIRLVDTNSNNGRILYLSVTSLGGVVQSITF
jgi:prefoldin alpha subunit